MAKCCILAVPRPKNWRNSIKKKNLFYCLVIVGALGFLMPLSIQAGQHRGLSDGQTLYVPASSHIYSGARDRAYLLTITLSIRNIDPENAVTITRVNYYETQGKLLKKHIDKPKVLKPLESIRYIIPESDKSGGSGANFMVDWKSDKPVNPPIVEAVMIGTRSQQGISFTSRGRVIIPAE